MAQAKRITHYRLMMYQAMSAVALVSLIYMTAGAQPENETCPCFSNEDVASIFLIEAAIPEEQRNSECSAEDFKVELAAELSVLNQDYEVIAKASVKWLDFDPGGCEYIDTTVDPHIEREVRWPHPAPESTARACLSIIASAIAKSDTFSYCNVYP